MPENQSFPSDVVQAIKDSVKPEIITVEGREFTSRPIHIPPADPLPDRITVHTLTGVIQFIKNFPDKTEIAFLQVFSADSVYAVGHLEGLHQNRATYLEATVSEKIKRHAFKFNTYLNPEDFIIGLQTGFADIGDRPQVLAVIGNLKDESVRNVADDGTTQTVTLKAGISLVGEKPVPNPVSLAPYRTFPEIGQPLSTFILRVQRGIEGSLPLVGLFETNDGQWELDAIKKIQDYLENEITEIPVIA